MPAAVIHRAVAASRRSSSKRRAAVEISDGVHCLLAAQIDCKTISRYGTCSWYAVSTEAGITRHWTTQTRHSVTYNPSSRWQICATSRGISNVPTAKSFVISWNPPTFSPACSLFASDCVETLLYGNLSTRRSRPSPGLFRNIRRTMPPVSSCSCASSRTRLVSLLIKGSPNQNRSAE